MILRNKTILTTATVMLLGCGALASSQHATPSSQPTPAQKPAPTVQPKASTQPPASPTPAPSVAPVTAPSIPDQTPRPARIPRGKPVPTVHPTPAPDVQSETVTAKLGRGGKVSIAGRFASLKISGWDGDNVEAIGSGIEIQSSGDQTHPRVIIVASRRYAREPEVAVKVPKYADVETSGGRVEDVQISDVDGKIDINAGNGDLTASRIGALTVTRIGGDITVSEVKGEFIARSTHGDVVAEKVGGRVEINLTSGDIRVTNAGGDVRANSSAGDVELHCVKGNAEVGSASGSITLIGIAGDAEASTGSGEVMFKGLIRARGSYNLKSLSGEIVMLIQPDPPGFTATLSTYNGEIDTNFPLKLDQPLTGPVINRRVTGRFGDGQSKVRLDSFNGNVKIVKGGADLVNQCK